MSRRTNPPLGPQPGKSEVKSAPFPKEVKPVSEPAHSQPAIVNERSSPILSSFLLSPSRQQSNS